MSRLLSVATLSVALFSCADEEIVGGGPRVQEGLPAQIVLKVASGDNRIETRAAQDAANEKRVTNLYVFVFDENGDVCEGSREYHNVPANGVVLTARSKNNAQIAGIAKLLRDWRQLYLPALPGRAEGSEDESRTGGPYGKARPADSGTVVAIHHVGLCCRRIWQ